MNFFRSSLKRYTMALLLLVSVGAVTALAQNESGKRPLNRRAFESSQSWYGPSTAMYHVQYPILRSLPPLDTNMPSDILAIYVYLDSIARFDNKELTIRTAASWRVMQDTLAGMLRYFYKVTDYDPIVFTQYCSEVDLKHGRRYSTSLHGISGAVEAAFYDAIAHHPQMGALKAALYPDYILRVKVNGIDSMLSARPSPSDRYIFRVTATVLDTLKGRVFSACPVLTGSESERPATLSASEPCLHFEFVHGNYFDTQHTTGFMGWPYPWRDPSFFVSTTDSSFMMHPGQEAIVFLSHQNILLDSAYDYFNLSLTSSANYNAMPIIDGKVRDINHVWSPNTLIDYAEWKSRFLAIRDKILNGTY